MDFKLRDAVRQVTSEVRDPGVVRRDARLHVLRFVGCNQHTTAAHLRAALDEVVRLGRRLDRKV
ncbi:hypothetical protein [Saccharothrix carnea]|uniref:hypothetical protein n=1 Tax=Saccharothrix carnea TaxID=1280637 RepID=UPI0011B25EE6|nr:hypothetical protein [Saccharothrix carnea]